MGDVDEIISLKYRYLRTLDLKQWDDFEATFVPEATGDYGADLRFSSREELVAYMRKSLGPGVISMHHCHHPEIALGSDDATGRWYLEDKVIAPEFRFVLEGAAFYEDRYVRTPDGWRIAHTGYKRTYEASYSLDDIPSYKLTLGDAYEAT